MPRNDCSYDLFYIQKVLKEIDKDLLIDLLAYLKRHNYDNNVVMSFFDIFKDIYSNDTIHRKLDINLEDKDEFLRNFINTLLHSPKINFVKDINNDKYFLNNIKKTNKKTLGYRRDTNGKYIIDYINPTYTFDRNGYSIIKDKQMNILSDSVSTNKYELYKMAIVHETSHLSQKNFDLYWYVSNREMFIEMLLEGDAIRGSSRIMSVKKQFPRIPFDYKTNDKGFEEFVLPADKITRKYDVYLYLYYKFEYLLGSKFMKAWLSSRSSITYLVKAMTILDEKYGEGTFKRLYAYTQLILYSYKDLSEDELLTIFDDELYELENITKHLNVNLYDVKGEELIVSSILSDEENLNISYDLEKEDYEEEELKMVKRGYIIEDEIVPFISKEDYKAKLEQQYIFLINLEQVLENKPIFDIITDLDKNIHETILQSKNDLTKYILYLENFMLYCMKKEENLYNDKKMSISRILNYKNNVLDSKFDNIILSKIKNDILDISKNAGNEKENALIKFIRKQL